MKINEAMKAINATKTVAVKCVDNVIYFYSKNTSVLNYFLCLDKKAKNWRHVYFDPDCLTGVAPEDLARVMDVVQQLLGTSITERFSEKKYRLRWIDDDSSRKNAIVKYDDGVWDMMAFNAGMVFTESELEQLKKDHPRFAPAIDCMKEEVKDDD